MHDLLKIHNPGVVFQLLQDCDLPDGRAGDAVVTVVNLDFFDSNHLIGAKLVCFVNDSIGTLT